jgi:prevent-host-death family protein
VGPATGFRTVLGKLVQMQVDIDEAKTRLSELVAAAERGDEAVITRNGAPVARLVAITPEHAPVRFGVLSGEIELGPDFDEPLPDFDAYTA